MSNSDIDIREKRRQELASATFAKGSQGGALMQPQNGTQLMDFANLMATSGQMVRDFYRGNPGDCAALIMICQPYGFNPFMVSWKTYKASKSADAPISFEGQLVNAMVNMSAPVRGRLKYHYEGEGDNMTCTVTGIDRETGEEITYTSPPVGKIPVKNSPLWKGDPQQQLGYYSARSWARRHFPELLLGVYTREEIEEAPMRDVTPKASGFAQMAERARIAAAGGDIDGSVSDPDENGSLNARGEPEAGGGGSPLPDDAPPAEDIQEHPEADSGSGPQEHESDTADPPGGEEGEALGPDEIDPSHPAYGAGQVACAEGFTVTDCPHKGGTLEAFQWTAGWESANA